MAKIRINMNFEEDVLRMIDDEAKRMGVNRTSCVTFIVSNYIQQRKALEATDELKKIFSTLESKGLINNE